MLRLAKGVADNSSLRDSALSAPPERDGNSRSLELSLRNTASIAVRALQADEVAVSCAAFGRTTDVRAGHASAKWDPIIEAAFAALANRMLESPRQMNSAAALSPAQLEPLAVGVRKVDARARINLAGASCGEATVRAVAITTNEVADLQLQASLELTAQSALAYCISDIEAVTTGSWRMLAANAAAQADASVKALDEVSRRVQNNEDAAHVIASAGPTERYHSLGAAFGRLQSIRDWSVVRLRDHNLDVLASSRAMKHELDALTSVSGNEITIKNGRIFVPLGDIVVALESATLDDGLRARLETAAARLRDIVKIWQLEADDAARRALLQRMALRMFAAVDEERARIARDLHDDQAQLLTAARIALEGGRDEARSILSQVEAELRRRTRELRPALLGEASLEESINRELERLGAAGVAGRFTHNPGTSRISRPIQQLCYQVTREAVSNVIRHAHARSVEVKIERQAGGARVTISDDGRGIEAGHAGDGVGLDGVRERVELLGGKLAVESSEHGTLVSAEIPEPAG